MLKEDGDGQNLVLFGLAFVFRDLSQEKRFRRQLHAEEEEESSFLVRASKCTYIEEGGSFFFFFCFFLSSLPLLGLGIGMMDTRGGGALVGLLRWWHVAAGLMV